MLLLQLLSGGLRIALFDSLRTSTWNIILRTIIIIIIIISGQAKWSRFRLAFALWWIIWGISTGFFSFCLLSSWVDQCLSLSLSLAHETLYQYFALCIMSGSLESSEGCFDAFHLQQWCWLSLSSETTGRRPMRYTRCTTDLLQGGGKSTQRRSGFGGKPVKARRWRQEGGPLNTAQEQARAEDALTGRYFLSWIPGKSQISSQIRNRFTDIK